MNALTAVFRGLELSCLEDVFLRMTKKALLRVMATLHALIARSDRSTLQKPCPFHMIGYCNNLQPSVPKWDRYSSQ